MLGAGHVDADDGDVGGRRRPRPPTASGSVASATTTRSASPAARSAAASASLRTTPVSSVARPARRAASDRRAGLPGRAEDDDRARAALRSTTRAVAAGRPQTSRTAGRPRRAGRRAGRRRSSGRRGSRVPAAGTCSDRPSQPARPSVMRSGVSVSETRVATRCPTAQPERRLGPTASTTPMSMPPDPVTGFCILPRCATMSRTAARDGRAVAVAGSDSWRNEAASRLSRSTAMRTSSGPIAGSASSRGGRLGQHAGRLEHAVHARGRVRPLCARTSLPSHPFDAEEPIASTRVGRRFSRRLTRVAEIRATAPDSSRRRHRARTALRVLGARARRARLAAAARLRRRDRRAVAQRPVAARQLREEPPAAARRLRRPARRVVLRRRGGRPGRPGDDVAAAAAADAQHDGARRGADDGGDAGRPGAPLHAAGGLRPAARRRGQPPVRRPRLAARARDVGGRGADPPLPHQGAGRAAVDLPAVLRPLHPHGPGGQLDARRPQAEVRAQAGRPARA